jgi:site-specific DNA recombinase
MNQERQAAATYARVSRQYQVGGESLDAQTAELLRFAEFKGFIVPEELQFREEGVSGRKASRPALDALLVAANEGRFQALLVWKVSRFGRSARHNLDLIHQLTELGISVHFVQDGLDTSTNANRALVIPVLSGVAELESENIREQSMLGKLAAAAKGKWQGGEAPFGTRAEPAPDGRGKVLVEEPNEAQALRDVWRWIVEDGTSIREAANRLNGMGIRTRRDRQWTGRNLGLMLKKPRLAGHSTFADIPIPVPAIYTDDEFIALNRVLEHSSRRYGPKSDRAPYPLSGLIVCGCGARWIGARRRGQRYYRCQRNDSGSTERCEWPNARWIKADDIENAVWSGLSRVLTEPARLLAAARDYLNSETSETSETPSQHTDDLERVNTRIGELEDARRRLLLDHAFRQISPAGVKDALAEIEKDLVEAQRVGRELKQISQRANQAWPTDLDSIALRARGWLTAADPFEQRKVMELLDIEVHLVDRDHCEITGSIPTLDPAVYTGATPQGPN